MIILIGFAGIQFIPADRNISAKPTVDDFLITTNPPGEIANVITVSCYDCHSDNTNYPWYSKIQPITMYMEDHILEGKAELNFSEWGTYSDRRKRAKISSMISQVQKGEMPLSSYTLLHGNARLSKKEKKELTQFLQQLKSKF